MLKNSKNDATNDKNDAPADLKEYREAVKHLAETKSPFIFPNSSPPHAAIVLEYLIKCAEKEIRIYDNEISGDLDYEEGISNQIQNFLGCGSKRLRLLVRNSTISERPIYNSLKLGVRIFPEQIDVRVASEDFQKEVAASWNDNVNFAVGDTLSYRIETQNGERTAECCFNGPNKSNNLVKVFDKHFDKCASFDFR